MEEFYEYFLYKYNVDIRDLSVETELNSIFEIGGQEGIDFLDDFLIHFKIQVDKIDYIDHFSPDGFGFSLPKFVSKNDKILKIKHLETAYKKGKWEYFS